MFDVESTIIAQASAQGNSRRGIVRLSGESVLEAVAPFFFERAPGDDFPPTAPRPFAPENLVPNASQTAVVPGWFAPWGDETPRRLVRCALLYWPKGRGFTWEKAVELHLPGAPPILDAAVRSICATGKARLARPGEFTLRAFLSGRIDLTQAEATLGVIDATSDAELQTALAQLAGNLSRTFAALRDALFDVLCDLEAGFDFVEEDIEFVSTAEIRARLVATIEKIDETLRRARSEGPLERAPRVALAGKPNAGKSSLFNALSAKFGAKTTGDALVSDVAGTTRDFLEAELRVDGVPFVLVDAAGVEKRVEFDENAEISEDENGAAASPGELAQRGLGRLFASAALILRCRDAAADADFAREFADLNLPPNVPALDVATKRDAPNAETAAVDASPLETSAASGRGIAELGRKIADFLRSDSENGEIAPSTSIRCQEALRETNDALRRALDLLETSGDETLVASEIRVALDRLGLITGEVHTEDLLDRIFSKFCVGK